ncbi:DUF2019 domain-containing protein [Myroides sp. C15-4]|uniref:DUF2019 domain-containing protein n=1 Tax=Myroides sp. C15-4 TaxID=3400532 RepID=UPI003D2F95A8
METMMTKENIKTKFLIETIEWGKAIAVGDKKKANKLHKKIQDLYNKAKELNHTNVFSELLSEPDESVRLWAATFTLNLFPDLAERTLEDLSELTSITGLSAETTLDLWRQGMLDLV